MGISQGFANYLVAEALVYDSVGADPRCWVTPDLGTTWSYRGNIFNTPLTDENYSLECAHVPGRGTNPLTDVWLHFIYCDYDFGGWLMYQGKNIRLVGIGEETEKDLSDFDLRTKPNPFRKQTDIRLQIADGRSQLRIYDVSGRSVKSFPLATRYSLLSTSIVWDGVDDFGRPLPSGTYFLELKTTEATKRQKVVLVR